MRIQINTERITGERSPLLYGHFIEHFHRQIYGGIYDPDSDLSDEDGMRTDIIEALKRIKVPILRWPGGCFVSSYHWKDGVGEKRKPFFDKAWRVEDPNSFGTDEFVSLCRKIGCEPYICTNAGTGTAEEMSDWVEYCNLENEGHYARWRISNGFKEPHNVRFWSIGNENYGHWEIGAKNADEWALLVRESAKMIRHVDPEAELSAAALPDLDWNISLLKESAPFLDWISLHEYWDMMAEKNEPASYEECMAFTEKADHAVREVKGLLQAMKLEGRIKIAFDEWNLRSWHHPNVHTIRQGITKKEYLDPRDLNDDNSQYTMADAVFSACFLNAMNRHCDVVGMANFAPVLNTRGCIFSHSGGIVLRSTYHVFDLYVNRLGDRVVDCWLSDMPRTRVRNKQGEEVEISTLDILATTWSDREGIALAVVNKDPRESREIVLDIPGEGKGSVTLYELCGESPDSYNDIGRDEVVIRKEELGEYRRNMALEVKPHSVNIIQISG